MKKIAWILILALLSAGWLPARAAEMPEALPDTAGGFLVHLREGLPAPSDAEDGRVEPLGGGTYLVPDAKTALAFLEAGADYVEPNYRMTLQDAGELQWAFRAIGAEAAWGHTDAAGRPDRRGAGVTVALIDSGVLATHPDLAGAKILPYYAPLDTANGVDSWHGTFVAGLIAAQLDNGVGIDGLAPEVTILPICATKGDNTDTATVVRCIQYAVEQGVDVINISIGGSTYNESLKQACDAAAAAGIIVVSCAGNYSMGTKSADKYKYPASFDSVVSVSSCRQTQTGVEFDEAYSYFNDQVTVSAPGTEIRSLYLDGGTVTKTGTSFSAPMVAAMAAIAKESDPALDLQSFTGLLAATSVDLGEPGYDVRYGWGFVDMGAFIAALLSAPPSEPPQTVVTPPETQVPPQQPDMPFPQQPDTLFPQQPDTPPLIVTPTWPIGEPAPFPTLPETAPMLEMPLALEAPVLILTDTAPMDTVPMQPDNGGAYAIPIDLTAGTERFTVTEQAEGPGILQLGSETAAAGETVFVYPMPALGAVLTELRVMARDGSEVPIMDPDGVFRFVMPAQAVTVSARFRNETPEAAPAPTNPFRDVRESDYYYEAVLWAVERGITTGASADRFDPDGTCDRAQTVTFLWRSAGCPEPLSTSCPFTDVPEGAYYYKAVLWAAENGITKGTSETTFSPFDRVDRGQVVTFLWRMAGSPPASAETAFPDVPETAYCYTAVLWAVQNGITTGTSATAFSPSADCRRAQIVTFLQRALGK